MTTAEQTAASAPSTLALYRDDGPLARLVAQPVDARLGWLVPPVVRAVEYGSLLTLTVVAQPGALPACFALLVALAYHHYDIVYRLRHQQVPPPAWVGRIGGGWEIRVLAAGVLAAAGLLGVGMTVAAVVLGAVYVAESVRGWRRYSQVRQLLYEEEEDEDV